MVRLRSLRETLDFGTAGALSSAVALLVGASLALACQGVGSTLPSPELQPPMAQMVVPPSFLTPRSSRYRVAVRGFVDQTGGRAKLVADAASEVLVTALHSRERFSLFDGRPAAQAVAMERVGGASRAAADLVAEVIDDDYWDVRGLVDGVLESYVTAISIDDKGSGHFEVDYRIVDPYSQMVVASGSARVGVKAGTIVRKDIAALANAVSRTFVDPDVMAQHEVLVSEVSLDAPDVTLTFDAGSDKQIERGFVGFVIEEDRHTRVRRYLAKFVVVNVFPQASIGVLVEHCNAVGRCPEGQGIVPLQQAKSVHVGSRVHFK
jgi:hypothetical protein